MVIKIVLLFSLFASILTFNCTLKFKFAKVCQFFRYDERCFSGQTEFCKVLVTKRDELKCPYFVCKPLNQTTLKNDFNVVGISKNVSSDTKLLNEQKNVTIQSEVIKTSSVHALKDDNKRQNLSKPINKTSVPLKVEKLKSERKTLLEPIKKTNVTLTSQKSIYKKDNKVKTPVLPKPKLKSDLTTPKVSTPSKSTKVSTPSKSPKVSTPSKSPKVSTPSKSTKVSTPSKSPKVSTSNNPILTKSPKVSNPTLPKSKPNINLTFPFQKSFNAKITEKKVDSLNSLLNSTNNFANTNTIVKVSHKNPVKFPLNISNNTFFQFQNNSEEKVLKSLNSTKNIDIDIPIFSPVKLSNDSKNKSFSFQNKLKKEANKNSSLFFDQTITTVNSSVFQKHFKEQNSLTSSLNASTNSYNVSKNRSLFDDNFVWQEISKLSNFTDYQKNLRQKVKFLTSGKLKQLDNKNNSSRRIMEVSCPDKTCSLEFREMSVCIVHLETNSTECNIPCNLSGCANETHFDINCPFWICTPSIPTTTSSTPTTTAPDSSNSSETETALIFRFSSATSISQETSHMRIFSSTQSNIFTSDFEKHSNFSLLKDWSFFLNGILAFLLLIVVVGFLFRKWLQNRHNNTQRQENIPLRNSFFVYSSLRNQEEIPVIDIESSSIQDGSGTPRPGTSARTGGAGSAENDTGSGETSAESGATGPEASTSSGPGGIRTTTDAPSSNEPLNDSSNDGQSTSGSSFDQAKSKLKRFFSRNKKNKVDENDPQNGRFHSNDDLFNIPL